MKALLVVAALMLCIVPAVHADPNASATAHVYLTIDPNIGLSAIDSNVNAGTLQTGSIEVPIRFRVDANTEAVSISALITNLYKGDDPTNQDVAPVAPDIDAGVVMDPEHANEIAGGDNIASYDGTGSITNEKGTFNGLTTEKLTFESSQNGHFSQEVEVTPTWENSDDEKPQGEYSGYVKLFAAVVD